MTPRVLYLRQSGFAAIRRKVLRVENVIVGTASAFFDRRFDARS
jgi:hypothetical protein